MALTDPGADRGIWKARPSSALLSVSLSEACRVGDILGKDAEGLWKRALSTVGTAIQGQAVALQDGATGDGILVSENPVVVGYSGGTPGAFVYVAEGTDNGKITETKPTDTGDCDTIIGVVLTSSVAVFFLGARLASLAT